MQVCTCSCGSAASCLTAHSLLPLSALPLPNPPLTYLFSPLASPSYWNNLFFVCVCVLLCFVAALLHACTVACVATLLPCFRCLFSCIHSLQLPHPLDFPACTFGFPSVLPQPLCTALSCLCPAMCLPCCSPPYFVALLSSPHWLHS